MSESVSVVIFENIDEDINKNINPNKNKENEKNEVEIIIDKLCNSLIIKNNELYYCKKKFTTKNSTKMYCDEHEFKNNMWKDVIECCICFETINKSNEIPLECGHLFHKECLLKTDKIVCPLCKVSFTYMEINYIKYKKELQPKQNIQMTNQGECSRNPIRKILRVFIFILILFLIIFLIKYVIN
jgi:hypothetical protein